MSSHPKFLVLFPGAWGNHSEKDVLWWFERFQPLFRGYRVLALEYRGTTIDEIAKNAIVQLRAAGVPPGSHALCYSMGSQVLRAVAAIDQDRFARAVFVSGLECHGIGLVPFANIALIAFRSFVASLLTGRVYLRTVGDCHRLMFSGEQNTEREAGAMLSHMHEEPMWMKIAQVFLPAFRKTYPPLQMPVLAVIPSQDAIVRGATYAGEHAKIVNVTGAHAFVRHGSNHFKVLLSQVAIFLAA